MFFFLLGNSKLYQILTNMPMIWNAKSSTTVLLFSPHIITSEHKNFVPFKLIPLPHSVIVPPIAAVTISCDSHSVRVFPTHDQVSPNANRESPLLFISVLFC
ncbi:hypothetical protein HanRHA438_Chr11g0517521 [Helianthus annuus]|nr:hypothetical protein HanRHA438_Chr11g0517521 [Helianthus annuus]